MSKLGIARVLEFRKEYIDGLEDFIEVAVFSQDDVRDMMRKIDLIDLELKDFKRIIVSEWPGIPSSLRPRLSDEHIVNEIYEKIVKANPMMHPKNIFSVEVLHEEPPLTDEEKQKIMRGFASKNLLGTKIKVITGNG